jgi:hypothetical protein
MIQVLAVLQILQILQRMTITNRLIQVQELIEEILQVDLVVVLVIWVASPSSGIVEKTIVIVQLIGNPSTAHTLAPHSQHRLNLLRQTF